jgi:hypothetical protein
MECYTATPGSGVDAISFADRVDGISFTVHPVGT